MTIHIITSACKVIKIKNDKENRFFSAKTTASFNHNAVSPERPEQWYQ